MATETKSTTLDLPWSIEAEPVYEDTAFAQTLYRMIDGDGAPVFSYLYVTPDERQTLETIVQSVNAYPALVAALQEVKRDIERAHTNNVIWPSTVRQIDAALADQPPTAAQPDPVFVQMKQAIESAVLDSQRCGEVQRYTIVALETAYVAAGGNVSALVDGGGKTVELSSIQQVTL